MKTLKISKTIILLALLTGVFHGCKKGENDPFLSFRTRDARLAGDWELSSRSMEKTVTNSVVGAPSDVIKSSSNYSGGTETIKNGTNPQVIVKYNLNLKIEKNGVFSYTIELFDQGLPSGTIEEKGYWVWASTGKRKSSIIIEINDPAILDIAGVWNIDELKNKEIIFKRSEYSKDSDGIETEETTIENSMTFTGK